MTGRPAVRELITAALGPLPPRFGVYAGRDVGHAFRELTVGLAGAQCATCFGWRDDPRHP